MRSAEVIAVGSELLGSTRTDTNSLFLSERLSALPLGLGFVPAFVGQDRRALHDRLADTRVVKA